MAWAFFTEVLGLDPDRLWVTVHLSDDEAAEIWEKSGRRSRRAHPAPRRGQLVANGRHRPQRPVLGDLLGQGPEYGPDGGPANPEADERYVEIWNLVFMQFDQQADGEQIPLPKPSIDTGAGLERVLSVIQGVDAVWATDEFVRLSTSVAAIAGVTDRSDAKARCRFRSWPITPASTTFLVNDGVFPSNEERGYVLRRIVRRAVRHAYLLGVTIRSWRSWSTWWSRSWVTPTPSW